MPNEQGMVFVEERRVMRQSLHEDSLQIGVSIVARADPDSIHDPMGIGIDHKYRLSGGIEDDGISRFLPDSIYRE